MTTEQQQMLNNSSLKWTVAFIHSFNDLLNQRDMGMLPAETVLPALAGHSMSNWKVFEMLVVHVAHELAAWRKDTVVALEKSIDFANSEFHGFREKVADIVCKIVAEEMQVAMAKLVVLLEATENKRSKARLLSVRAEHLQSIRNEIREDLLSLLASEEIERKRETAELRKEIEALKAITQRVFVFTPKHH